MYQVVLVSIHKIYLPLIREGGNEPVKTGDLNRTIKSSIIIKLTVWGAKYMQFHSVCNQHTCHLQEDLFLLISKCCTHFILSLTIYRISETHNSDSIEFVAVF